MKYVIPKDVNNPGLCLKSYLKKQVPYSCYSKYEIKRKENAFSVVILLSIALMFILLTLSSI